MSMETYRLEVSEMDGAAGVSADVYDEDGVIAASRAVLYDEFDVESVDDGRDARDLTESFDADVTRLELEVTRDAGDGDPGVFEFAAIGDGQALARISVDVAGWRRPQADG